MIAPTRCIHRLGSQIGLVTLLVLFLVSPTQAQRPSEKSRRVVSPLRVAETQTERFVTRLLLNDATYREAKSTERITIVGFALSPQRRVDLELERIEAFAPDAIIVMGTQGGDVPMPRPDVVTLGGHIKGQPDSHVFLSLSPHGNNGFIDTGTEKFVVSTRRLQAEPDTVIYNLTTLPEGAIVFADWKCDTVMPPMPPGEPPSAAVQHTGYAASTQSTSRRATLAIETDYEFTSWLFGGDFAAAEAYVATLVAAASQIYWRDVGTRLEIGYLHLETASNDRWRETEACDTLHEFRDFWNGNRTWVARNAAQMLSGRYLGGGCAYLPGLCWQYADYGVSAVDGFFPYPLENHSFMNWDIFVFAHELGHNFNAPHTHEANPTIDGCGNGNCIAAYGGTIMSYCHTCPGGMSNIDLRFHEQIINTNILPYLDMMSDTCDLSVPPEDCTTVEPPSVEIATNTNRTLSVVGGNPWVQTGLRVTISNHLPPFDVLNGTQWWVADTQIVSESGAKADPAEAPPGTPTYRAATLQCEPYFTDWAMLGPTHVSHEVVIPGGTYTVEAILGICPQSEPSNWSAPLTLTTSKYGDVVGDCSTDPCSAPNGTIDITTDVTAILNKFKNLAGAPIKARADVEPATVDFVINISDVTYALMAFRGFPYQFPVPTVNCP